MQEFDKYGGEISTGSSRTLSPPFYFAATLLLLNWLAFASFLVARPSEARRLESKDLGFEQEGVFSMSTGDPWAYIADRPLYNWSEWHGGEANWVKVVEVINLPALYAASVVTQNYDRVFRVRVSYYRGRSWIRAWSFAVFASVQWLTVGTLLGKFVEEHSTA